MRRDRFGRAAPASLVAGVALALALGVGSPRAHAENRTVIRVTVVETKDRLPPDPLPGIERRHDLVATLSGKNQVSEKGDSVRIDAGGAHKRHAPPPLSEENSAVMGDESGRVVWHVLGERKLQRIRVGDQFLTIMNIEIDSENRCQIEVKYLEQKGFTDVVIKRPDNGEMAHFTLPRLVSATCSIE
jgi:hypothetical protein